jgi:hypothetical protein
MTLDTPNSSAHNLRGDLETMNALDLKIPGGKLPVDVEKEYKRIIDRHEQCNSPTDRAVALSARIRLLEHQFNAKQREKCVESLTMLMQKYPELCQQMRILAIASEVHAADSEAFMSAYERAGGATRSLYFFDRRFI